MFIFSNSMQSGAASGLRSAAVTQWLNGGLARMGVGWRFSERLVRKLGHFSEYALLGFWLMLSLRVYTRRILFAYFVASVFGLLAGVLDEGIQMFADGRGSDVRDVVIDFSGVVFGLLAALFLLLLVRMFHVLRESKTPALGVLTQENRCFLCQRARDAAFFICKRKNGERGGARPMKAVLFALNAKYIHSSLAPWCLLAGVEAAGPAGVCAEVREGTVNEPERDVLARILDGEPDAVLFSCYL